MPTEILNGNISHRLSDDVKIIVEEIARELNFSNFEITVKHEDFTGDNYLGDISRIKLAPVEQDGQKPINLVVKRALKTAALRKGIPLNTYYKREIFTYTDILPVIDKLQDAHSIPIEERISFAKFYNGISEDLKEVMVMKDLADDDLMLHDKSIAFDYEHAAVILQYLARLHACSFVLKEKEPEVFARLTENVAQTMNYAECLIEIREKMILKILPMVECPKNRKKLESFIQKVGGIVKHSLDAKSYEPYNVICHGDCWNNNMLFKYEKDRVADVVFVDWQLVRLASPATDLVNMMFLSMEPDTIELHLQQLLEVYFTTLETSISRMGCDAERCYPKKIFKEHFKSLMNFGFLFCSICIPILLGESGDAKPIADFVQDLKDGKIQIDVNEHVGKRISGLIELLLRQDEI